jgi:hypothetical protein
VSDILGRLAGLAGTGPEIMLEVLATVIDGLGTGEEWTGEQLDRLGELTQQLADKVRGVKGDAA